MIPCLMAPRLRAGSDHRVLLSHGFWPPDGVRSIGSQRFLEKRGRGARRGARELTPASPRRVGVCPGGCKQKVEVK